MGTRRRAVWTVAGVLVFAAIAARDARAQTPARLVASVSAGSLTPVHGDDHPEGPIVLGSIGWRLGSRVWIESEITRRAYRRVDESHDVILPITVTPIAGTTGHADRAAFTRRTTDWTGGVNVVRRMGTERLAAFAGGGAGLHHKSLRETLEYTNCVPPSASPAACQPFDQGASTVNLELHGIAGVEVSVAPRLSLFGAVRYEARPDLGLGAFGFTVGVRIPLR